MTSAPLTRAKRQGEQGAGAAVKADSRPEEPSRKEEDLMGSSSEVLGWGILMDPQSVLALGLILVVVVAGLWYFLPDWGQDEPQASPGYQLEVWAQGLDRPTSLVWGPDYSLYVGLGESAGSIMKFQNLSGDLIKGTFVTGTPNPYGLVWVGNWLYISDLNPNTGGQLEAYQLNGDFSGWSQHRVLIDDLPVGEHQNNGVVFGPDGYLYLAVGATCARCDPVPQGSAAILRVDPADGNHTEYATGLGNPYGLAFHPVSNHLFATENGGDGTKQYDELNRVIAGDDYGWPNDAVATPEGSRPPVLKFPADSVPTGIVFTRTTNLTGHVGDALVALSGSPDDDELGHKIVKVNLTYDPLNQRYLVSTRTLVTGLPGPLDLTMGPDGALYIADYLSGQILKLSRV